MTDLLFLKDRSEWERILGWEAIFKNEDLFFFYFTQYF